MNVQKVKEELSNKYPNKLIIENGLGEVVCEIKPASEDPDESIAIAVIDNTKPHYHKTITEKYEVIEGELELFVNDQPTKLKEGDSFIIKPLQWHYAKGNETWIKCTSNPAWNFEDHLFE